MSDIDINKENIPICICECPNVNNNYIIRANVVSLLSLIVTTYAIWIASRDVKTMIILLIALLAISFLISYLLENPPNFLKKRND